MCSFLHFSLRNCFLTAFEFGSEIQEVEGGTRGILGAPCKIHEARVDPIGNGIENNRAVRPEAGVKYRCAP